MGKVKVSKKYFAFLFCTFFYQIYFYHLLTFYIYITKKTLIDTLHNFVFHFRINRKSVEDFLSRPKDSKSLCIITVPAESEEQQRLRFQVELEFVQCLANPNYLHCEYLLNRCFFYFL